MSSVRRMKRLGVLALAVAAVSGLTLPSVVGAGVKVKLRLPVRAKVDLTGRDSVAIAPFLVVSREGTGGNPERLRGGSVDIQREFERYLTKLIRRETDLRLLDSGPIDYPTSDLEILGGNRDFWRAAGERWQTDVILAGSLDFDVQDKSGYRTEEYISPFDGRTYYRQVLVEQTGFDFDIVLMVFDGATGERLYFDNFKDFKQFEGENADPLQGMFENLASLENRILNVFAQKTVEATRILLTN